MRIPTMTLVLLLATAALSQDLENVALGMPYTMTEPTYRLCTDADDAVQLTDGVRTEGHFWTNKTTVGWSGGAAKFITIDLGEIQPICGIGFSTAAGVADVEWPSDILVFVSDDGDAWHMAGDLLDLSAAVSPPPDDGYATHVFRTTALHTHAQYVQIVAVPDGSYLFVDEIEVYRGEDAWLAEALPGDAKPDVRSHMAGLRFNGLIKAQLRRDLNAVRADIEDPGLPEPHRTRLSAEVDRTAQSITDMAAVSPDGFRAILPMTDLEREIFRLQASVWRAQEKPELRVWKAHRWDPLPPSAEPSDAEPPILDVAMMTGEYRADVLNFTNARDEDVTVRFSISGLPGGTNPEYISVHEVLTVGTRRFVAVSSALPLARREGAFYVVTVPSGMTKQVWLGLNPREVDPGSFTGRIDVVGSAGETQDV